MGVPCRAREPDSSAVTCPSSPRIAAAGLARRKAIPAAVCSRWNYEIVEEMGT
jgi:hypothetical protein